jgi:hypothetical protein
MMPAAGARTLYKRAGSNGIRYIDGQRCNMPSSNGRCSIESIVNLIDFITRVATVVQLYET